MNTKHILWFDEVGKDDVNLVGGKGANLGEMVNAGIPVPYGYIVTAKAYFDFLKETGIRPELEKHLKSLDAHDPQSLDRVSKSTKQLIMQTKVPHDIAVEIMGAYEKLSTMGEKKKGILAKLKKPKEPLVAIRSSATAEDLPTASFAGQQATYLNVSGEANVVEKVKECWASLFEARAIFYRTDQKFDHFKVGIAVPVQRMVQSEKSGVMFSVDPISGDKNAMIIEAIYGLGEYIVQGTVTPDHYEVDKKSMHISKKTVVEQTHKFARIGETTKDAKVEKKDQDKQKISDKHILELAKLAKKLEHHYYFPQDIEWAIENDEVFIVQTRAITTLKGVSSGAQSAAPIKNPVIATGNPASPGIASGPVHIVRSIHDVHKVKEGEILVASQTNPDYVPAMRKVVAIVTEHGGRTSHAAIVSRELGVPAVVGAGELIKKLKDGQIISVDGKEGKIYDGPVAIQPIPSGELQKAASTEKIVTATKVYVNLAEPSRAKDVSKFHVDGIGLLRAEFMIANIGIHPKKLIKEKKQEQFVQMLADQLEIFCKSFSPRPVVYRATDFKTNEYRNLVGGKEFEPEEANPMLGFRGAARYTHDPEVFTLELEAIKRVRNKKNLKNLWLMIPFVRTPKELEDVKKIVAAEGLTRSSSFKLWMMCELPINVILLDEFIDVGIDGVSIGSNDLTMLIMGTDRDNSEVANLFDERNPAVQWALERVIKTCHKRGVTCGICGQAPSDYPELVENLVKWGVTSVSVNPDAIDRVRQTVHEAEKKIVNKK